MKDAVEERGRIVGLEIAVEFEELGEEGEDECEGYLRYVSVLIFAADEDIPGQGVKR